MSQKKGHYQLHDPINIDQIERSDLQHIVGSPCFSIYLAIGLAQPWGEAVGVGWMWGVRSAGWMCRVDVQGARAGSHQKP